MNRLFISTLALSCIAVSSAPAAEEAASSSLLANTPLPPPPPDAPRDQAPHALRSVSLFAVTPPEARAFRKHDLVQIIVRETSQAKSSQDLETKKNDKINAAVNKWPNFTLEHLLNFQLPGGKNDNNPALALQFSKEFKGEGDYARKDDLTARLTAEVLDVLPNGNLVLEARTTIKTDDEVQTMKATGICRPDDITAANTILSNQIHDLVIEKVHQGELRKTNERGIIGKVIDTIFAF